MSETTAAARIVVPLWRRMLFNPVLWGTALLAAATALTLGTQDIDLPQFLLMLVGGWCFGLAFVNATFGMRRNGLVLHLAVAIVLLATMLVVTEYGSRLLDPLPDAVKGVLLVLWMAAIPATGWIVLGLLGRVTDALTRRERKKTPVRVPPEWERDERGDGSFVRFPAIEMRMRELTLSIIGITVFVGLIGIALLISFSDVVMRFPPRLAIVLVGLMLGLPAYLVLTATLRKRTKECTVAFGNDEIRIRLGDSASVVRFSELEHLRWRCRSDYARIEVRGPGVDLSLFAGLAKAPPGRTSELPVLPRRVFRRLELSGLVVAKSRRDEVITFSRAV